MSQQSREKKRNTILLRWLSILLYFLVVNSEQHPHWGNYAAKLYQLSGPGRPKGDRFVISDLLPFPSWSSLVIRRFALFRGIARHRVIVPPCDITGSVNPLSGTSECNSGLHGMGVGRVP
ncbi:hypothetical protein F4861DRAFT_377550 [Xylaria intraflava]|nr:hypothetical protein F4861DRAFT_377550 [Xylaria intraflava]